MADPKAPGSDVAIGEHVSIGMTPAEPPAQKPKKEDEEKPNE